ncbi:MAG TPA: serine/threonine-protein kinase, partial [Pyrinomonadaceae bacterium]|nr:serine/threonine-protein kinase [Pyrinomonadaceae bacterium]
MTADRWDDFLEPPIFEHGLRIIGLEDQLTQDLIGTTINDRYLIEAELKPGGMGRLYLARALKLHNKEVLVKILSRELLSHPYAVTKFKQEAEALSRLDHPNVVGLLDAGRLDNGTPYTVMQLVRGQTLRSQISNEGMDLDRTAAILKQVGAGLDHVHEKKIFHRDLKPENIMLQVLNDGTEWVKVIDFGIAKVKDSQVAPSTIDNVAFGTIAYMSPEQVRGDDLTAASDVFSLAVVAYEMITGRRPFNPKSAPDLLKLQRARVRVKPVDLRPELPPEAQAVLLRALSFEPKDRYQSAGEFANNLARALTAEKQKASFRNAHALPRRPLMIAGLSTILVCVALAVVVYTFVTQKELPNLRAGPSRAFSYSLTVQRMRGGEEYQEPFQSNGQEPFVSGDRFRLNVSSPESGYLYVFNEGPPQSDHASFKIVYPTNAMNNAS